VLFFDRKKILLRFIGISGFCPFVALPTQCRIMALSIGVNHGGMGAMHPSPKFTVGDGYIAITPIRMFNWTADKTAACVLLRKQRDMYALSIFPP